MSAKSGLARSISAGSPPAMIVSVPVPDAGGPPETGASIQPHPVAARSFCANALHFSTLIVEKSITSCGVRKTLATPSLAEDGLLDRIGGRQVEEHQLRAVRRIGGRGGRARSRRGRRGDLLRHDVAGTDRIAERYRGVLTIGSPIKPTPT
jgi:hypothetical protein